MNLKDSLIITKQQEQDKLALEVKKDVLTLIQSEIQEINTYRSVREKLIDSLMEGIDPTSDDPLGNQGKLKFLEIIDKGSYERAGSIISGMKSGVVINNTNTANSASNSSPTSPEKEVPSSHTNEELDVFKKFLGKIKSSSQIEDQSVPPIIDVEPIVNKEFEIKKEEVNIMSEVPLKSLVFKVTEDRPPIKSPEPIEIDKESDDINNQPE
jgi:hypothetical protein